MISLHIIVDNAPDERLDRALLYLTRTHQTAVCIGGGAQLDRTMQYIERVRAALPNIIIMMRILEDTGIVLKLPSTQAWYDRYVTPRLQWLQHNKITLVVDNETSGDDTIIKNYVQRCVDIANMLHDVGIAGAYCRFATGNIVESQYALLKPLLDFLRPYDWISPNEYSNAPGKSSGGHLERWKRIQAVTAKKLNVSIGECGILNDYKARSGYLGIPISGASAAAQLLADEIWYNGGSIPRFWYLIGGYDDWQSMRIGDDALEYLEAYYAKNPIGQPIPVTPPPVTVPPVVMPPSVTSVTISVSVLQAIRDSMQSQINVVDQLIKTAK